MTLRAQHLKAIALAIAFLLIGWALDTAALQAVMRATAGRVDWAGNADEAALLQSLVGIGIFAPLTWLIGARLGGLDGRELGLRPAAGRWRALAQGVVIGAAPSALALVLAVPAGARWAPDAGGPGDYLLRLAQLLLVLAPAALAEELLFRGAPLALLRRAFGVGPAVVATATAFAFAHRFNPGIGLLAFANIGLAGVLLGLAFFLPGGLWTAFGAHLGWNAALAALDAPVSGLPFRMPMLDYVPAPAAWIGGGSFGPEGGVVATFTLTLAAAALAARRRPTVEAQ